MEGWKLKSNGSNVFRYGGTGPDAAGDLHRPALARYGKLLF
jgi:hypothetical protein